MDGQTLVMIFSNNVNSGPSGKFLHLLRSKQTTLAYDVLDFSLILSYVVPKGLSFCPVATTSGHWTETKPIVKYWDIAFETPLLEL